MANRIPIQVKQGRHIAGIGPGGSMVSGPAWALTCRPDQTMAEAELANARAGIVWLEPVEAKRCVDNGDAVWYNENGQIPPDPALIAAQAVTEASEAAQAHYEAQRAAAKARCDAIAAKELAAAAAEEQ